MAQTHWVADQLRSHHPSLSIVIRKIITQGDRQQKAALPAIGGKGLFTAELESELLAGTIDLAVHSAKDLPTRMPEGLTLAATPLREDPRDALISRNGVSLANLPGGAVLGTSSLRRQAQLRITRPDLTFTVLRGNVDTRIRKVQVDAQCDATLLAMAGLKRLALTDRITQVLDVDQMVPAAGQGTLAIQSRAESPDVAGAIACLHHVPTYTATLCERRILEHLQGGCQAPVGVIAVVHGDRMTCKAVVVSPDGRQHIHAEVEAPADGWSDLADKVVRRLVDEGAASILQACREHPWSTSN